VGIRRPSVPLVTSIDTDDAVDALRLWAYAALAEGDGATVQDVLVLLRDRAVAAPSWPATCAELHVRVGIATNRPDLIAFAALGLLDGRWDDAEPAALLPMAVGAQWLLDDAVLRVGPAVRFRESRAMLAAARWALARSVASGTLDSAALAEGAAALDRLYAGAWREREPLSRVDLRGLPAALVALDDELRLSQEAPPEVRDDLACDALWQLAQWCEPSWPATGGPWWTSQAHGLTVDIATPRTDAQRHRFALADVYLEVDEIETIRADGGFADETAEPLAAHLHELARQALGHAVGAGLLRRGVARRRH
jgi:hypothetical protein